MMKFEHVNNYTIFSPFVNRPVWLFSSCMLVFKLHTMFIKTFLIPKNLQKAQDLLQADEKSYLRTIRPLPPRVL